MEFSNKICIICAQKLQGVSNVYSSATVGDEITELKKFICKIFCLSIDRFECFTIPFCRKCTSTRIQELLQLYNELLPLQINFISLKKKLMQDILTCFFTLNPVDQLSSDSCGLLESIIKKWEDGSPNFAFSPSVKNTSRKAESIDPLKTAENEEFMDVEDRSVSQDCDSNGDITELETTTEKYTRQFKCPKCSKILPRGSALHIHIRYCKGSQQSQKMSSSNGEEGSSISNYIPEGNEEVALDNDQRQFKVETVLKDHPYCTFKIRVPKEKPKCPHCSKELSNKSHLAIHIRTHTKEKPFDCPECGKKYGSKWGLLFHRIKNHEYYDGKTRSSFVRRMAYTKKVYPKKKHKCQQCMREFCDKQTLKNHRLIHAGEKPFKCNECDFAFRRKTQLLNHKKLLHGYDKISKRKTQEGINTVVAKFRVYCCGYCSGHFQSKGLYNRHLLDRHNEEINEGDSLWYYYCDSIDCSMSCVTQNQLRKHLENVHKKLLGPNELDFPECDICQRIFTSKENLNIHRSCHKGTGEAQEKFGCEYCYQVFESEKELNDHKSRHQISFSSQHLCDSCGKGFTKKHSLDAHISNVHSGTSIKRVKSSKKINRNYECALCFNFYRKKGILLSHLKSVHYTINKEIQIGDQFWYYDCEVKDCFTSCTSKEQLKKHFDECHEDLKAQSSNIPPCDICKRSFYLQESFEAHKSCHLDASDDKLQFSCKYCVEMFSTGAKRRGHAAVHKTVFHLADYNHFCDLCGKAYRSKATLGYHKRTLHEKKVYKSTHRSYSYRHKCSVCHKKFPNQTALKNHQYKHTHPDGFKCHICNHKAPNPTAFTLHMAKIHPEADPESELILKHTCEYCGRKLHTAPDLHRHSIMHHQTEYLKGKSYCRSCYAIFETEKQMEAHYNERHRQLICPVLDCQEKFSNSIRLRNHSNIHKNAKPHICQYCQKGFGVVGTLQYHINTKHTFHRSFRCRLCPDNPGYYERRSFYKHLENEHPTYAINDILIVKYPRRKCVYRNN